VYTEPVRLVLWDIDGTLVDTVGHGRHAFTDAFEQVLGRPVSLGDISMSGRTDHSIALELLERNGEEPHAGRLPEIFVALNRSLEGRRDGIAAEGRVMPGVAEVMRVLAERDDVTQSLLTGNIEPNAHVKLAALGLDGLVDMEIGGYGSDSGIRPELVDVAREKAALLRGVEVAAADTVLIGDTPLDVDAAHANGARAVAVATGHFDVEQLRATGAEAVLADASDVQATVAAILG
jgi:phosphoglycolate phosphatase-like HAD superfamily hydrolase